MLVFGRRQFAKLVAGVAVVTRTIRARACESAVAGIVCDAAGRPIPGALVELSEPFASDRAPHSTRPARPPYWERCWTDSRGRFRAASAASAASVPALEVHVLAPQRRHTTLAVSSDLSALRIVV